VKGIHCPKMMHVKFINALKQVGPGFPGRHFIL
jgi:hypothetical protein